MGLRILQWNARSLISNGQDFKKFVSDLSNPPDVICIQETWLLPHLSFSLQDYIVIRCGRLVG